MKIVVVNDTRIWKAYLFVKSLFHGNSHESTQISPFGDDANPCNDIKALKSETNTASIHVILGYFNRNLKAGRGEKRIFSTDENGTTKTSIWLKNDGTIEINTTGEESIPNDFLVKYNELKTGFDKLVSDFNTFKATHTHLGVTSGTAVSGISTDTTPSTADISSSKATNLKIN